MEAVPEVVFAINNWLFISQYYDYFIIQDRKQLKILKILNYETTSVAFFVTYKYFAAVTVQ